MTNKDEALKHHAEKYGLTLDQFRMMCKSATEMYEGQGMKSLDYALAKEAYFAGFTKACKEALEQEERTQRTMHCGTADAFIAMDDDHKRRWFVQSLRESKRRKELEDILEQPAQDFFERGKEIAKWADKQNEQPAQEPVYQVGETVNPYGSNIKIKQPAQEPVYIVGKGWNCDEMPAEGTKLYTHPAPSWQGLSDEEQWNFINKSDIPADYDHEILAIARTIEQALKGKNASNT